MEPKLYINKDNKDQINKDKKLLEREKHFLSLRKNKRINIPIRQSKNEQIRKEFELNQNSYNSNNTIIQNFFTSSEKTAFLYDLVSNIFNSQNNANCDLNLAIFIVVQIINYYKANENDIENIKKFFTNSIIENIIEIMNLFKEDKYIVYNISYLLAEITDNSSTLTKLVNLNSQNIQKIFNCLKLNIHKVNAETLKLLYNCYFEDENAVNPICNIGMYVFESLSQYKKDKDYEENNTIIYTAPYYKQLVSFLNLLINEETKEVYKQFKSESKNEIINLLLVICRDAIDEEIKLDAHKDLVLMLGIINEEELYIHDFGIFAINDTFLPHIKLESNSPDMVVSSIQILDKFSYLISIEEIISKNLINQIEEILLSFIDMNENKTNPKFYYKNYTKINIGDILKSITNIIYNSIYDEDSNLEKYIINKTRIIDYLTLCLKINDIEEEDLIELYSFFKDFLNDDNDDSRNNHFFKLILVNFIQIGMVDSLKNNINNKKHKVIKNILEICLMMLKECDKLRGNDANFLVIYLEKKGFVELLTTISGFDFGNIPNSDLARNIHDNFFK